MRSVLLLLFVFANLAITAGYIYLAFAVVPKLKVTLLRTKVGGIGFFLLCGLTHLLLALAPAYDTGHTTSAESASSWVMLAVHLPQAVAVWLFVSGLYIEVGNFGLLRLARPVHEQRPGPGEPRETVEPGQPVEPVEPVEPGRPGLTGPSGAQEP